MAGTSVKTLKRVLKKAGLKTSGRKAALTRRAKKAHLTMRGGDAGDACTTDDNRKGTLDANNECIANPAPDQSGQALGGRRRGSRKSRRRGGMVGKESSGQAPKEPCEFGLRWLGPGPGERCVK